MTGTEIYKRTSVYDRESSGIRLHAPQWKLLLAFDGQRSLTEVALSIDVPFSDALPLTEKFLGSRWIEEQPITLEQYLKRTGAASAAGSAVMPATVLHKAEPETAKPEPVKIAPPPIASAFPTPAPTPAPVSIPAPAPIPAPPPVAPAEQPAVRAATGAMPAPPPLRRPGGPLPIKAVVDFVISQVGNNSLGQLVVYRIFLRVPPQLLQAEDIASVHLVNDPSLVKGEPLKQAIAAAVLEVLKRPLNILSPA